MLVATTLPVCISLSFPNLCWRICSKKTSCNWLQAILNLRNINICIISVKQGQGVVDTQRRGNYLVNMIFISGSWELITVHWWCTFILFSVTIDSFKFPARVKTSWYFFVCDWIAVIWSKYNGVARISLVCGFTCKIVNLSFISDIYCACAWTFMFIVLACFSLMLW